MNREQLFLHDSMQWFRKESGRFSTYHWRQLDLQAGIAAERVANILIDNNGVISIGVIGFGFGRDTGIIQEELQKRRLDQVNIVGLDINASRFVDAEEFIKATGHKVQPLVASMNAIPLKDNSLTVTVCLETMLHSDEPKVTLKELVRVTEVGGLIIFNMGKSHGFVSNIARFCLAEGFLRALSRVMELLSKSPQSAFKRTTHYREDEINDLVCNMFLVEPIYQKDFICGLSTFIIFKKR